jgi:hypothetical protein
VSDRKIDSAQIGASLSKGELGPDSSEGAADVVELVGYAD